MLQSYIQKTRIENNLPVAREGLPFIIPELIITILMFYWGIAPAGMFLGLITLFTIYFFRDPERTGNAGDDAVLSPADGTIIDIRYLEDGNNNLGRPALKISVFMSVFNVHVNRIPVK